MKMNISGNIVEIDDQVVFLVRGATTGMLIKMFFDNGGIMINSTDGKPNFSVPELNRYSSWLCFMSLYVLATERKEGPEIFYKLLHRFAIGQLDSKGRAIKSN